MRIVREQMLCIVSPGWKGPVKLTPAEDESLRGLLADVGVIHFAAIGLLPPRPTAGRGAPALLLELAVDEGLRPHDLLTRLVHHPSGALWAIYGSFWSDQSPPSVGERNEALLAHLLAGLSVADGGFIGPRDLSVLQIARERELWDAVRSHAASPPLPVTNDPSQKTWELIRRVFGEHRFAWAMDGAPRSYWRGRAKSTAAKLGYVVFLMTGVWVGLWLTLWLVALLAAGLEYFVTPADARGLGGLLEGLRALPAYWVALTCRVGQVLLGLLLGFAALIVVPGWIFSGWRSWFRRIDRELDRPTVTWSAQAAYLFAILLVVAAAAATTFWAAFVVLGADQLGRFSRDNLQGPWPEWLRWAAVGFVAVFGALFVILLIGLRKRAEGDFEPPRTWLARQRKAIKNWFHRPRDLDVKRPQQAHPSIEQCEAELVQGTAHMMSLTELRRPYAWSAWWTRRVLRLVTTLGHILFTEGRLGNAPGIHFAHWHLVDNDRRLLFCANFDGTFGGYLDDFIKGPSAGTTLFWRWSELRRRPGVAQDHPAVLHNRRFPPTRLLFYRGVKCELWFKAYARESMLPRQFRFDASGLSVAQKMRANRVRDAVAAPRTMVKDDVVSRSLEV